MCSKVDVSADRSLTHAGPAQCPTAAVENARAANLLLGGQEAVETAGVAPAVTQVLVNNLDQDVWRQPAGRPRRCRRRGRPRLGPRWCIALPAHIPKKSLGLNEASLLTYQLVYTEMPKR